MPPRSGTVDELDRGSYYQRRIRQVTSFQIRNLTPFPVRDAFASALSQPSESSQFTPSGHFSDDLDVTVSQARKRSRKSSTTSIGTLRSVSSIKEEAGSERGRRTVPNTSSSPKVGFSPDARRVKQEKEGPQTRRFSGSGASTSSAQGTPRPGRKNSASSTTSHTRPSLASAPSTSAFSIPTSSAFRLDTSQRGLEKVIKSRLVETFIVIRVPHTGLGDLATKAKAPQENGKPTSRPSTPSNLRKDVTSRATATATSTKKRAVNGSTVTPKSPPAAAAPPARTRLPSSPPSRLTQGRASPGSSTARFPGRGTSPAPSTSSRTSSPSSTRRLQRTPSPTKRPTSTASTTQSPPLTLPPPSYISPIHRPSTNPVFSVDPDAFFPGADLGAGAVRIEVWGRVAGTRWGDFDPITNDKGKGKGKARAESDGARTAQGSEEWSMLASWDVALDRLAPVPDVPASKLPSNTLLLTLAPRGETFMYVPPEPGEDADVDAAGYNSDPETVQEQEGMHVRFVDAPRRGGETEEKRAMRGRKRDTAKTASYHDLVKLVTLHAAVADTRRLLAEVAAEVEKALDDDGFAPIKREVSEREFRVKILKENRESVEDASKDLRSRIETRREELRQRRSTLELARKAHEEDLCASRTLDEQIAEDRDELASLRTRLPPVRAHLIATLAGIFPIELASPADLLFTIVGVPLPIPLGSNDPAPPLSLPKLGVTEDGVASALGFAAQAVQMLAAYAGVRLVYPVTCVGSRSLVKDEISAMVGPRMFPLYSKGVDAYRFEYAVFLLNKDIEILTAERDLRALDMRHTLPNLKNLFLTLTDGESARVVRRLSLNESTTSLDELETAVRAASPTPTTRTVTASASAPQTPRAQASELPPTTDADAGAPTPPEPDSERPETPETPKPTSAAAAAAAENASKKPRGYLPDLSLGFGFLSLRGRPAAAAVAASASADAAESDGRARGGEEEGRGSGTEEEEEEEGEGEGDRRTVRGAMPDDRDRTLGKIEVVEANGHAVGHGGEKEAINVSPETPTTPRPARTISGIVGSAG
ncbi:hypothetical protein PUNSTDRAFT_139842 [Punctularia strigosozonata HHB-11173 SS5]|uniref:uncharacterized protein n=1 Tax=Punctularia strigosozonata (strain HHB-11173) TaxID=741275 RepID=UPI000441849F|nr:uncharacterized protein PUNSTDRAFT_139842 [Punctularia strigosozonata HHB-11173 SS5]EIN13207.1 hypothetical protein PUNSTDRAFT_139842 [Punctularia strigosozonata HHB-11173 SS5]